MEYKLNMISTVFNRFFLNLVITISILGLDAVLNTFYALFKQKPVSIGSCHFSFNMICQGEINIMDIMIKC